MKQRATRERRPKDAAARKDVDRAPVRPSLSCSAAMSFGTTRMSGKHANLPFIFPKRMLLTRAVALAIPKSVMRAVPSTPMRMFCGETSRWTRPITCRRHFETVVIVSVCAAWSGTLATNTASVR